MKIFFCFWIFFFYLFGCFGMEGGKGVGGGGVALFCAFCERHGPSILFSTSKLELARTKEVFDSEEETSKGDDVSLESRRLSVLFSPSDIKSAPCNGCKSIEVTDGFVSFSGQHFCTSSKFPERKFYAMARSVCVKKKRRRRRKCRI